MIDISSSTAQSDQTSQRGGTNAGITFGPKLTPQTMLIVAAVLVAGFMLWKKGR